MGSLKDELAKLFPEQAKPKKRKKKHLPKGKRKDTAASVAETEDNWKTGVRPLKRNGRRSSPSPKKTSRRQNAGMPNRKKKATTPFIPPQRLHEIYSGRSGKPSKSAAEKHRHDKRRRPDPSASPATLAHASLSRESEFKRPNSWVEMGCVLQPHASNGRILPIRMGIDFGTAYTKTALRVADTVFFVDWDGIRSSEQRYILPGEFSIGGDGIAMLGRSPEAREIFNNLKLPFLAENEPDLEDLAAAVVFLALTMRYARAWLYQHHAQLLQGRQLAWQVNLGLPTSSWESTSIFENYGTVGLCAWQLSQSDIISMECALHILSAPLTNAEEVGLDEMNPIPEFAAQISGYVQSPQRQDGLHLLFDVGAGTVDIATFNVHREGNTEQNVFPIFANTVDPLGTHRFMAWRLEQLGMEIHQWDDLQKIPTSSELTDQLNVDPERVSEIDADFGDYVGVRVRAILRHTKHDRYALAPEWNKGVRAFLAGGGGRCQVYESALQKGFREHCTTCHKTTFPGIVGLPAEFDETVFHRLTVAHGLTYDAATIGTVRGQDKIVNQGISDLERNDKPDHEDMYTE